MGKRERGGVRLPHFPSVPVCLTELSPQVRTFAFFCALLQPHFTSVRLELLSASRNCRASSLLHSFPSARGVTALKPSLEGEAAGSSQLPRAHGGRRNGQAGANGLRVRIRPNHRQHPRHQSGNQRLMQVREATSREAISLHITYLKGEFIINLRKHSQQNPMC